MDKNAYNNITTKLEENVNIFWEDHPILTFLFAILVTLIMMFAFSAIYLSFHGVLDPANVFAEISSAFATILLVGLTAIYVVATKRLVSHEKEDAEYLRQSLRTEIRRMATSMNGYGKVERMYQSSDDAEIPSEVILRFEQVPTYTYHSHLNSLGVLGVEEAATVNQFYCLVENIKVIAQSVSSREQSETELKMLINLLSEYAQSRPQIIEMLEGEREPDQVDIDIPIDPSRENIANERRSANDTRR